MQLPLVTYEQAVMLKECGFNWNVNPYFKKRIDCDPVHFECSYAEDYNRRHMAAIESVEYFSRPCVPIALLWLDSKRIIATAQYAAPDTNKFHYRIDSPNGFTTWGKWYDTRMECESAALTHALEILKQKDN